MLRGYCMFSCLGGRCFSPVLYWRYVFPCLSGSFNVVCHGILVDDTVGSVYS